MLSCPTTSWTAGSLRYPVLLASSFPMLGLVCWAVWGCGGQNQETRKRVPGAKTWGNRRAHQGSWSWAGAGRSGAGRLQPESSGSSDSPGGPPGQ